MSRRTLSAQLPDDHARRLAEEAYYCPNPSCQVAYFDTWGTSVARTVLRCPAYPKSPTAPVCSCFGITAQEIREEAEAGRRDRVREMLARAESAEARCETESPSGSCCATEVRRIFMKHFSPK